jgi:hypothetical protein
MRHKILLALLTPVIAYTAEAQQSPSVAFAITSAEQGKFQWTNIKMIDLSTGEVLRTIYDGKQPYNAYNARTRKEIAVKNAQATMQNQQAQPLHAMSAALAYDKRHNRLYYTPMYVNQLRYIDLSSQETSIYYFDQEKFSNAQSLNNEASHITRMVIAADGKGYAVSNDGNHFVQFTTGKKPTITDLGALQDDPKNSISIHEKQTSWGGDMIADATGNLYIISAFHNVFKINIRTRIATHIAKIEGLPANFTTNGAVVNDEGRLVVSSASSTDGYYAVDMNTWKAERLHNNKVFNASDLANGNLAFSKNTEPGKLIERELVRNNKIGLYPNPVTTGQFRVTFNNRDFGRYDIQVVDLTGKLVATKTYTVSNQGQVAEMDLRGMLANGTYLVKVLNQNKKTVFSDKIVVTK